MYFQHTNPIAIRSKHMISDALTSLMKRQPFHKITITQICEEAAIGRKTFYRNFELKEDVVDFQLDQLYQEYETALSQIPLEEKLKAHLAFLYKHMGYIKILHQSGLLSVLTEKFIALSPKMMPRWSSDPIEQQYISAYVRAGTNAIVQIWIARNFEDDIDSITSIAQQAQTRQILR